MSTLFSIRNGMFCGTYSFVFASSWALLIIVLFIICSMCAFVSITMCVVVTLCLAPKCITIRIEKKTRSVWQLTICLYYTLFRLTLINDVLWECLQMFFPKVDDCSAQQIHFYICSLQRIKIGLNNHTPRMHRYIKINWVETIMPCFHKIHSNQSITASRSVPFFPNYVNKLKLQILK